MQRATPRYRSRRSGKGKEKVTNGNQRPTIAMLAASALRPPPIIAQALEDNGLAQPIFIEAWVGSVKFPKTLLDRGALVELISRRIVKQMKPTPTIYQDGSLRVSLAIDTLYTLTEYVLLPVNVQGVQALIKA